MPAPPPRPTVYLESRYRKLERGLPQTIFYCPECQTGGRVLKDRRLSRLLR